MFTRDPEVHGAPCRGRAVQCCHARTDARRAPNRGATPGSHHAGRVRPDQGVMDGLAAPEEAGEGPGHHAVISLFSVHDDLGRALRVKVRFASPDTQIQFSTPIARCNVRRAQPLAVQAHHHTAVLDLCGVVPRRARLARSRADRCQARASMSRKLTLFEARCRMRIARGATGDGLTRQNASP
jgi:hypothetical protein